jgi:adenylate cyclase class IV
MVVNGNNLEVKVRLPSGAALRVTHKLASHFRETLHQTDTYFRAQAGRLKLREFGDGSAQLIGYARADTVGDRTSVYHIADVPEPAAMTAALSCALGVDVCVVKVRQLFLPQPHIRIHVDAVHELGDFLEIEVIATEGGDQAADMAHWRRELGLDAFQAVGVGYRELLLTHRAPAVRDLAYYRDAGKVFWVAADDVPGTPIKRYDVVPCIFVEVTPSGRDIVQLDPVIAHDGYKYTCWRKLIGRAHNFRADVLLVTGDRLVALDGTGVDFDALGRSPRVIGAALLARFDTKDQNVPPPAHSTL